MDRAMRMDQQALPEAGDQDACSAARPPAHAMSTATSCHVPWGAEKKLITCNSALMSADLCSTRRAPAHTRNASTSRGCCAPHASNTPHEEVCWKARITRGARTGKLLKRQHGLLDGDVVEHRLLREAQVRQRLAAHEQAGIRGQRVPDRLGDKGHRARCARVGLDDVHLRTDLHQPPSVLDNRKQLATARDAH